MISLRTIIYATATGLNLGFCLNNFIHYNKIGWGVIMAVCALYWLIETIRNMVENYRYSQMMED